MAINKSFAVWIAGAALSAASLVSGSAFALAPPPAVPATLTQQGRILDPKTGEAVVGKVKIAFNVYATATGGDALWTEEQNITLDDGYFSAQLGSASAIPAGVFDGSVRYLGVTVGADDEMTPREAITSVPYSLLAGSAAVATSVPFTGVTGFPAACADGQYLKGFSAAGAAICGTLPTTAFTCDTVSGAAVTGGTAAFASCPSGTVLTGGGCYANVALTASYVVPPPPPCTTTLCQINLCQIGRACYGDWNCLTASAGNITAYARCCKVM
ncbi:MAG: hypothetical protein ABJB12_19005 [Pseudomonadota bacterium]